MEDSKVAEKGTAMKMEIYACLSRSRYLCVCKAKLLDDAGRLGLGILSQNQFLNGSYLRIVITARESICAQACKIINLNENSKQGLSFAHLQLQSLR
jgi:hypothetical protein